MSKMTKPNERAVLGGVFGMKKLHAFTIITLATLIATHSSASAATLGSLINNLIQSTDTVPGLLVGVSYLIGIVFGFLGIMKLKDHVENAAQVPVWEPIKRFIAGGSFFALPTVVSATVNTVSKGMSSVDGSGYNLSGASGAGLDAKLIDLIGNIWDPLQFLFAGFGYVAGLILVIIGITRLLKTEQEGPRGPMGLGTIATFIVAGLLLSLNKIIGATVGSIFSGNITSHGELAYTAGMDGAALGHANAVIGAIMAFVAILGWISFLRGFFIMRGVAEGNSQASMMAGMTHILGGALAVNLGGFISAVQNTLGISDFGITFSSLDMAPYLTTVTAFA